MNRVKVYRNSPSRQNWRPDSRRTGTKPRCPRESDQCGRMRRAACALRRPRGGCPPAEPTCAIDARWCVAMREVAACKPVITPATGTGPKPTLRSHAGRVPGYAAGFVTWRPGDEHARPCDGRVGVLVRRRRMGATAGLGWTGRRHPAVSRGTDVAQRMPGCRWGAPRDLIWLPPACSFETHACWRR
jgi:hypothetical protein